MIVIVNPPNPPNAVSNKDTMGGLGQLYSIGSRTKIPPIDIAYAAALLRKNNFPVAVIDCLGMNFDTSILVAHLLECKPSFIAIRTSTPTLDWDINVAAQIKKRLDAPIIFFGPHATLAPDEVISHLPVDSVILGEPEYVLLEIAQHDGFRSLRNVWYRGTEGIIKGEGCAIVSDLDALPHPAWDLMPYQAYDGTELMNNIKPFVTMLSSRGCPHGCLYCPYTLVQGRQLRVRSARNVVNELEWITKELGVRAVLFRDPEFALQRARVVEICEGMLARNIRIAWRCETRPEDLDEDLIALMAKSGCIGINIGFESVDSAMLARMNRKTMPLAKARQIIASCKRHSLKTFSFFILGLPGDSRKSIMMTILYVLELNSDFVQFSVATPYPGTELKRWAESRGFIEDSAREHLTGYSVVMRNENLSRKELRWLLWYAREALEMRACLTMRRVLQAPWRVPLEIKRSIRFQFAKWIGR